MTDQTPKASLLNYLGNKHTVWGWERFAMWLLIAWCLGIDVTTPAQIGDAADHAVEVGRRLLQFP